MRANNQYFWWALLSIITEAHRLDFSDQFDGRGIKRYTSFDAEFYHRNDQGRAAFLVGLDAVKFEFPQLRDAKAGAAEQ